MGVGGAGQLARHMGRLAIHPITGNSQSNHSPHLKQAYPDTGSSPRRGNIKGMSKAASWV